MRIELITQTYSNATDKAAAEAAALVLSGGGTPASGEHYAPPGNIETDAEVEVQESKPIGAEHRRLFMRGNQASSLSFEVKPKYATLEAAAAAVFAIEARAGASGQLRIVPAPESTATPALVYPPVTYDTSDPPVPSWTGDRRAVIKRIRCKQTGVTVEAKYEIEW